MGLSKKTFLYSMAIAAIMVAFIIGYFVLMLPSLYVDYVKESNYESVVAIQEGYIESRTYDNLEVKNPSSVYTLEVPYEGTKLYLSGKFFKLTADVKDAELITMLDNLRNRMKGMGGQKFSEEKLFESLEEEEFQEQELQEEEFQEQWETIKEKFRGADLFSGEDFVEIQVEKKADMGEFTEEYTKVHAVSDRLFVYEAGASDGNYGYTTYTAFSSTEDAFIITVVPTLTPRMDEIRPVVMGSLPMIIAVIFLLILISSRFFSGKIVNPIIRLAGYAESAKLARNFDVEVFDGGGEDEIGALGRALQELYEELRDNYLELEQKNNALKEENTRQEVFLRASSHQLKTPISAALLLVEGMMNEVGKYKNTKEYLPEVKKQLLSMRKIVEDILYLNYHADHMQMEAVSLKDLTEELLKAYTVQLEDKKLNLTVTGNGTIQADREMMKKIMDNLYSNAAGYTPEGGKIEIMISGSEIQIENSGVTIDEALLPNVFDPFVSSDESRKGKGLGLYVASYYSRLMGFKLEIDNVENGVRTRLIFQEKKY
ncbi:MAG: HAMP domain-containing histidine kinase [Lachnospiraceae bacterium]|nr:HAMP domain-containing histidine kinase [Lachnospiraceae bacterium]MDE6184593.1 HAMP domain-containing histidine kinase [Lachnospiraceae bacterium]